MESRVCKKVETGEESHRSEDNNEGFHLHDSAISKSQIGHSPAKRSVILISETRFKITLQIIHANTTFPDGKPMQTALLSNGKYKSLDSFHEATIILTPAIHKIMYINGARQNRNNRIGLDAYTTAELQGELERRRVEELVIPAVDLQRAITTLLPESPASSQGSTGITASRTTTRGEGDTAVSDGGGEE